MAVRSCWHYFVPTFSPPRVRLAFIREAHVAKLDHLIVKVNDHAQSVRFYSDVLGFAFEGTDGPFSVMRVDADCVLLLSRWGTPGGEHYAFSVSRTEFDAIFARIRAAGIGYGPTFDTVGSNREPGEENGARGVAPTLYFNDPNQHLLEIRTYD